MTGNRAVIAALALAFTLGVSGCSDEDPEPRVASSSPTPTPTDPPSTPAPPSQSAMDDQQAAVIEEFFSALTTGLSTGDPSRFLALAAPACANCEVLAQNLSEAYASGGRIEGGLWQVAASRYVRDAPLGAIWNVDIESSRETWFDGNGEVVKIVRAGTQKFGLALEPVDDSWQVRELRLRER